MLKYLRVKPLQQLFNWLKSEKTMSRTISVTACRRNIVLVYIFGQIALLCDVVVAKIVHGNLNWYYNRVIHVKFDNFWFVDNFGFRSDVAGINICSDINIVGDIAGADIVLLLEIVCNNVIFISDALVIDNFVGDVSNVNIVF